MRIIGLTGGIGCGKSTAAKILRELGAEVLDADVIGHQVYRQGTSGFRALVAEFGPEIVGQDGEVDRKRLGAIVFSDPARLEQLNHIVHPLIRSAIESRIEQGRREGRAPATVVEAAILLEAGWRDLVDEVWVVSSGRDQVVERLEEQRGLSRSATQARIAQQMSDADRRAAGDVVIENGDSIADLRRQVEALWDERVRPADVRVAHRR